MKNPLSTTLGKVLLVLGLLVIGIALVFWLHLDQPMLALYTIFVALILVGLWFGINWLVTLWTRRKQQNFDASVAAREGIEDRKREWSGWIAELKKQGIDRYKLPMYLLVGEPQSGKSILLHNSDLHFPFGQNRLSGIGGTRGCDWWFTEEAVILDLAGRLFTHEGGKSDEAEWEAFLGLLSAYRPESPANGILLVLPCDGLLQDSPEKVAAKSGRMQSALLALTNKLEARMPVYVVLTKGDKIFGFAETFHRLTAEKRQEMLGWSRGSEKVETPFDAVEAREAFEAFVARMRTVRADTLSTEVLPEGQAAADRMFAFPDELAAIQPNLILYLQRIFSESTLVDRLFYRGFYLTSGLQSGAPIAKVCSEMLGAKGQADLRTLESIFTKQRAFFIKDLVRKRIFVESGLVRPTKKRITRSRRNTAIGYGVGGLIVLASIYFAIDYLREDYSSSNGPVYDIAQKQALEAAESVLTTTQIVEALRAVQAAADREVAVEEKLYFDPREKYQELYVQLFDHRFLPRVREAAEHTAAQRVKRREPKSHDQFLDWQKDIELLLGSIDASDTEQTGRLIRLVAESGPEKSGELPTEQLIDLFALRGEYAPKTAFAPPAKSGGVSNDLDTASRGIADWWDGVLEPGGAWQAPGEMAFVLACLGLRDSSKALKQDPAELARDERIFNVCEKYRVSYDVLSARDVYDSKNRKGTKDIAKNDVLGELETLKQSRARYLQLLGRQAKDSEVWSTADEVRKLVEGWIKPAGGALGALKKDKVTVPTPEDCELLNDQLREACDRKALGRTVDDPGALPAVLASTSKLQGVTSGSGPVYNAFRGRTLGMNSAFKKRYESWNVLADELGGPDSRSPSGCKQSLALLSDTRKAIGDVAWNHDLKPWMAHVEDLYVACAAELMKSVDASPRPKALEKLDLELLPKMHALMYLKDASATECRTKVQPWFERYLAAYEESALAEWKKAAGQPAALTSVAGEVNAHLEALANRLPKDAGLGERHKEWLNAVNVFVEEFAARAEMSMEDRWNPKLQSKLEFRERITAIKQAYQDVRSRYKDDDHQQLANSGAVQAGSALETALPALKKRLDSLREFARPTEAGNFAVDDHVTKVHGLVAQYENDSNRIHDTDAVVTDLGDLRKLRVQRESTPALSGGPRKFYRHLSLALEKALRDEALRVLEDDFDKQIRQGADAGRVLKEILAKDPADLKLVQQRQSGPVTVDDIQNLFGRNKTLDGLLKRYRKASELVIVDAKNLTPQSSEFEKLIVFLDLLQRFLLKGEELKDIQQVSLSIDIQPQWNEPGTLWKGKGSKLVFYNPSNALGGTKEADHGKKASTPLTWAFDSSRLTLRMVWSDVADVSDWKAHGYGKDDAYVELQSAFAPLLMVWWWGKEDKGIWSVEVDPEQSNLRVPFQFTFKEREQTLPRRDISLPP